MGAVRERLVSCSMVKGPGKGSSHKHLNLQMALMFCSKQPVLTDEPVNPG